MPASDNSLISGPNILDEGVIEIRGGGPGLDRDEQFCIRQSSDGGYELETAIREANGQYRLHALLNVDTSWRPKRILARAEQVTPPTAVRDYVLQVEADEGGRQFRLETRENGGTPHIRQLPMSSETMVDIEPSTLPMWCMTRRYDHSKGGVQHFHWLGQSLIRDLTLTGLDIPIECTIDTVSGWHIYQFTETYPSPAGDFVLYFTLQTDDLGWLQLFEVRSPSNLIRGVRRKA